MKIIKVQYTVKEEYVEENKKRIETVMKELRNLNNPDIKYQSILQEDGKTFVHLVHYNNEAATHLPVELESFKQFQSGLKEHVEIPPKVEKFELVDASFKIF